MKFKKFYEEILVQRILRQNRLHHGLKIIPLILINSRNRVYHSLFLKFITLIIVVEIMNRGKTENGHGLRVVQTQVILFLKSMSERVGSNRSAQIDKRFKLKVVLCQIRLFQTFKK